LKKTVLEAICGTEVVQMSLNALGYSFFTTSCRCVLTQIWMQKK
jgi:hypothetical protein